MEQVVSNYISRIETKKSELLKELDGFPLEYLLSKSNHSKTVSPTKSFSTVSAPHRPWLIFGGCTALAGSAGMISWSESSDKNWALPLLISGLLSVAYGLIKMKNLHSALNVGKDDMINPDLKNTIYEKISELTDNIINKWNDFIVPLNQDVQEYIKSEQGESVDKALNETYYHENIKIDKFKLYMALKNISIDNDMIINYQKLVERYLADLKKVTILTADNQIMRYKKVDIILSNSSSDK